MAEDPPSSLGEPAQGHFDTEVHCEPHLLSLRPDDRRRRPHLAGGTRQTYETQSGDLITISQPAATMMAGSEKAMAQEQAYFAALTKATNYAVTSDSLTLMGDQGGTLVRHAVVQPTTLEGHRVGRSYVQQRQGWSGVAGCVECHHRDVRVRRQLGRQREHQPVLDVLQGVGRHDVDRCGDRLREDGWARGSDEARRRVSGRAGPLRRQVERAGGRRLSHGAATRRSPAAGQSGRTKENVVPRPSSVSTLTLPPCASTTPLTIARPRPLPPVARLRETSPR